MMHYITYEAVGERRTAYGTANERGTYVGPVFGHLRTGTDEATIAASPVKGQ